jgi:hypothetical protein
MAVYAGPEIVNDGLAVLLDAANAKSYPGSGTTWTDVSGNNNNATLVNGVGYDSNNGGSLTFDGVDDYCIESDRAMPATLYPFSYSCWGLFQDNVTTTQCLISVLNTGSSSVYWALGVSSGQLFVSRRNTTSRSTNFPYYPEVDKWFNVHINYNDTTSVECYINGQNIYSSTSEIAVTGPVTANDILIGLLRTSSPTWRLNGKITGILLYNRILTNSEIQQNFNAHRGRFGI